jgi:fructose-bisphosphate aldolase class II
MSLVSMDVLLKHARENGYGIPAFNVYDLKSMQSAIDVAEEEDAPIIIMGYEGHIEYAGGDAFSTLALSLADRTDIPIALHLDHGSSFEWAMKAIRYGFTSVMVDASRQPFEKNVEVTKRVVEAAHAVGVSVEAELGHIETGDVKLTEEQAAKKMTDPAEAAIFVEKTGVDALAVAVGNAHGLYKYEPKLDFRRLEDISRNVDAYIVLHGGSGTPGIADAIKLGVTKINIYTDTQVAFRNSIKRTLESRPLEDLDAIEIMRPAILELKGVMRAKIREFKCHGHGSRILCGFKGR